MKLKDNRFEQMINKINNVSKYYTCPNECNAMCCKKSKIRFDIDEYQKILKMVGPASREIIETQTVALPKGSDYFRKFEGKCPLLNDFKCDIYANRPWVCQRYPFEFLNHDYDVIIKPCSLGLKVILDYFVLLKSSYDIDIEEITPNIDIAYGKWIEDINLGVMPVEGVAIAESKKDLTEIVKYLQKTTPEIRQKKRNELITKIKTPHHIGFTHFQNTRFKV